MVIPPLPNQINVAYSLPKAHTGLNREYIKYIVMCQGNWVSSQNHLRPSSRRRPVSMVQLLELTDTHKQTDLHTHQTDTISSTADVGGKKVGTSPSLFISGFSTFGDICEKKLEKS